MKRILEDIRLRKFQKVYLIFGNEPYLVREMKERLFHAIKGEDSMNCRVISGREVLLEEARDFTDTAPFFAEKRVLLLEDTKLLKSSEPAFSAWIESLPDTAVVIFAEEEVDKRTKLYKTILKTGYLTELNHLTGKELSDWVLKQIGKRKVNITQNAFRLLINSLPESMEASLSEIEKLCDYVGNQNAIREEDVEAILTPRIENQIFKLVEQAVSGRREEAFRYYYDLVSLRESPLKIISLIGKEFMRLFTVRSMASRGVSAGEIAKSVGIPEFVVRKLSYSSPGMSEDALLSAIDKALELEQAVKSGNLQDSAAAELLLFELT